MNSRQVAATTRLLGAAVIGGFLLLGVPENASAHGGEKHSDGTASAAAGTTTGNPSSMEPAATPMKHMDGGHAHGDMGKAQEGSTPHGHGSGHRHDSWATPPAAYARYHSMRWADPEAISRGATLYETHCASCHGSDGRGGGPAGKALEHAPADLTVSYHTPPHDGDAYLFWRVSEGGTVEPFRSQNSQMPAFKSVLSEDQRWDVLAYVHAYFHLGLYRWRADPMK